MAETELERAEKRYAQAKARLLALKNRAATQARKLDTRRKVILGGALVDLAARDDGAAKLLDRLVRNLPREASRFERGSIRPALPRPTASSHHASLPDRVPSPRGLAGSSRGCGAGRDRGIRRCRTR